MSTPPIAKKVPSSFTHLGQQFQDDYAWLQDKTDPSVIAYLEAENAYTQSEMAHLSPLREQLFREMCSRIEEDESSVPELRGEYLYYWRMEPGKQYRIYCRKKHSLTAEEEIILDVNQLAEGKPYCRLQVYEPSPDQRLLAYSVDHTGSLIYDLYIKDLSTGQVVDGPIANTAWNIAWASDSRTLFYPVFNAAHRPYQLYRHQAGVAPQEDQLVYHETDEAFNLSIRRARSGAYLLVTLFSGTTSEVRYLPAGQPTGEWRLFEPRRHWVEYYVEPQTDRFIIRTNDEAVNFKLLATPFDRTSREHWQELLPHRPDTLVEGMDAFQDYLVVYERCAGLSRVRISAPDGVSGVHYVAFPDSVYALTPFANAVFTTQVLRFLYNSLVTPASTIDYHLDTHTWQVMKVQHIPSGYDASQYTTERLMATAPDGAQVPISLVYRRGLRRDGSHPALLVGYGSYGYSYDPDFDSKWLSLLERGFVCAIAHVRGGSELGRLWYEHGRLLHKMNTFTDFIACAEHLIAQGYTRSDRLAIMGGSAGGLLVTAVTNLRPELFKAVVARVPFTNVITAMLLPELPLTIIEWEQWGNPADAQAFDYMLAYSPYENITAKAYPHLFVKAGLHDLQVPYWDPAKYVARLRSLKTDANRLWFYTNLSAGHAGASGRYDHLQEDAQMYAFLIDSLEIPHD